MSIGMLGGKLGTFESGSQQGKQKVGILIEGENGDCSLA